MSDASDTLTQVPPDLAEWGDRRLDDAIALGHAQALGHLRASERAAALTGELLREKRRRFARRGPTYGQPAAGPIRSGSTADRWQQWLWGNFDGSSRLAADYMAIARDPAQPAAVPSDDRELDRSINRGYVQAATHLRAYRHTAVLMGSLLRERHRRLDGWPRSVRTELGDARLRAYLDAADKHAPVADGYRVPAPTQPGVPEAPRQLSAIPDPREVILRLDHEDRHRLGELSRLVRRELQRRPRLRAGQLEQHVTEHVLVAAYQELDYQRAEIMAALGLTAHGYRTIRETNELVRSYEA